MLRGLAAVHLVRDLKRPPARLLDQARVRDGAFDIGMFRSYFERAAKLTGEHITDMVARPLPAGDAPATPADVTDPVGPAGGGSVVTGPGHDPVPGEAAPETDDATNLRGLISRAMESADLLAKATRRTRRKDLVPTDGHPSSDDRQG